MRGDSSNQGGIRKDDYALREVAGVMTLLLAFTSIIAEEVKRDFVNYSVQQRARSIPYLQMEFIYGTSNYIPL